MVFIYSLKLTDNKYYIGKTDNPNFRLENHFESNGSAWTKKYNPVSIHQVIPDQMDHDEQRITQEYMVKYGIDNVRGGPWCKVKLSPSEKEFIQELLNSENDKCYQCGSTEHFAAQCNAMKSKGKQTNQPKQKKLYCERCGRNGHTINDCRAKKDINGDELYDVWECEFCGKEFDSEKGCLFHENVHCTKRRRTKQFDSKALYDEMYDSDESDEYDEYDLSFSKKITCYRCGRDGHKSTTCYATRHIKGYYL